MEPKPNSNIVMDNVEKGALLADEVPVIRNHLLAALMEHTFNIFFVVILAGYIILIVGALKYYELQYAVLAIVFMSPYYIMMLEALPFLKRFYIKKYATVAVETEVVCLASATKFQCQI